MRPFILLYTTNHLCGVARNYYCRKFFIRALAGIISIILDMASTSKRELEVATGLDVMGNDVGPSDAWDGSRPPKKSCLETMPSTSSPIISTDSGVLNSSVVVDNNNNEVECAVSAIVDEVSSPSQESGTDQSTETTKVWLKPRADRKPRIGPEYQAFVD
jgi:hypothetical protein